MRLVAAIVAVASLSVMTAPPSWAPDSGSSCGTSNQTPEWRGSMSCHFWFRGFPIIVRGDALGGAGNANLRVWISSEHSREPALLECRATDTDRDGYARCSAGIPDESTPVPWPTAAQFLQLFCHVEGASRGTVLCSSGSGS